jgi:hypothetical protein
MATDIGRANVREIVTRVSSISLAKILFFGQSLSLSKAKLPIAGKNSTGIGSKNLVIAV